MKEFKLQITVADKWHSLSDIDQAEHKLRGSELWNLYRNYCAVTNQVAKMNENVSEEFHVRIPTMYYLDPDSDIEDK